MFRASKAVREINLAMSNTTEEFTVGVEEEYQIINRKTRELHSRQERILNGAQDALGKHVTPELYLSQMQY
jgi:carboxylate-amine ligase